VYKTLPATRFPHTTLELELNPVHSNRFDSVSFGAFFLMMTRDVQYSSRSGTPLVFDAAGCESEDATMLLVPPDRSSFKWLQQLPVFHAGII